jgi:hypothetical protein
MSAERSKKKNVEKPFHAGCEKCTAKKEPKKRKRKGGKEEATDGSFVNERAEKLPTKTLWGSSICGVSFSQRLASGLAMSMRRRKRLRVSCWRNMWDIFCLTVAFSLFWILSEQTLQFHRRFFSLPHVMVVAGGWWLVAGGWREMDEFTKVTTTSIHNKESGRERRLGDNEK